MHGYSTRRIAVVAGLALFLSGASSIALAASSDRSRQLIKDRLDVSDFALQDLDVPVDTGAEEAIRIELASVDSVLILRPHSNRSDLFSLFVESNGGTTRIEPPAVRTFKGEVMQPSSPLSTSGRVRATIRDGKLWALIRLDDGSVFGVQPLSHIIPGTRRQSHVVYDVEDLVDGGWMCGVDQLGPGLHKGHTSGVTPGTILKATGLEVCEVGIDADYEFYVKNGSSVINTLYDVENVMNGVESIYENDCGITYEVTTIVVRTTSASNPYTTNDPGTLLSQFRSHWILKMVAIERDVAHLFTGRSLISDTIGVAYPSGICNNDGYGLSESKFSTNFAYRVGLTAHEMGHNWSAGHCTGSTCYLMCATLGSCGGSVTKFGTVSKNTIINYKNTRPCLDTLPDPLTVPFKDSFPTTSIDGNKWTHVNGAIINGNGVAEPSPTLSLNLDATSTGTYHDDEIRSNFIQAAGMFNLVLGYFAEHRGVEAGEELVIEYWAFNQKWVEVNRITSDGVDEDVYDYFQHSLGFDSAHDQLRIRFRSEVDGISDDWYIDDVTVTPCSNPITYGTGEIGSSGTTATIGYSGGKPLLGNPDFSITLTGGNPNATCVVFSGDSQGSNPQLWGDILVAGPNFLRTWTSVTATGTSALSVPIEAAMVGTTKYFQYAVRDPGFGGNVQASDGIAVTFCP